MTSILENCSLIYILFTFFSGTKWEDAFLTLMESSQDWAPNIEIFRFSSLSMERELENNTNSVIPFFSLNLGVMIAFCIVTCMMTDWVKSKPVLGKVFFHYPLIKSR